MRGSVEDGVSDNSDGSASDDDWASEFEFVRVDADEDSEEAAGDIRWRREELGVGCAVAKFVDNGWDEERKGIDGDENAKVDDDLHPALPVGERLEDKLFVIVRCEVCRVVLEALDDKVTFTLSQECCSGRVVVHVPVGDNGNENGQDTFEEEDPLPPVETSASIEFFDSVCKNATKCTSDCRSGEEDGNSPRLL